MNEPTGPRLHSLLSTRWSPTTFDPSFDVSDAQLATLFEAARWAPSAGNSQPWAFIVTRRGEHDHARLARHLARSSGRWAPEASVLIANLAHLRVEGTDLEYSEFAQYDLGQAVAHLSIQAQSLGLQVRQFRAFDREAVAAEFDVPAHWQVTTMAAIGRVPVDVAPDRAPAAPPEPPPSRERRAVDDIVWPVGGEIG